MTLFGIAVLIVLCILILLNLSLARDKVIRELRSDIAYQDQRVQALQRSVEAISDQVVLTRQQRRMKWFENLPAPQIDEFKRLSNGVEREFIVASGPLDYEEVQGFHYRHERIEFRSGDESELVAYGEARPWATVGYKPTKIILGQYGVFARIIGLDEDGFMKFAPHNQLPPE